MTKLEEEIATAMFGNHEGITGISEEMAKAAAEVAKKYIEKAFEDGYYASAGDPITEEEEKSGDLPAVICWKRWLKENGITV